LEEQYARTNGKGKGKLEGKFVGVKDMFALTGDGSRTTCASRMLQGESEVRRTRGKRVAY